MPFFTVIGIVLSDCFHTILPISMRIILKSALWVSVYISDILTGKFCPRMVEVSSGFKRPCFFPHMYVINCSVKTVMPLPEVIK